MKKFNLKKWITENKHGKTQTEQLGPRIKSPRPTGPSDPRSSKDIEFDNAQAMSRLTPDDKDKLEKIKQMMDKEKQKLEARADWTPPPMGMGGEEEEDEEQEEYDKGWYGESLKEAAFELGYLKEISGMEDVDNTNLEQIKSGINKVTGGGRQTASVSDKGNKIMILFKYVRSEFEERMWENILDYLTENMGFIISYESNNYEENYDKGEPAEAIPTIEINKTKELDKPDEKDNTKVKNTGSKLRLNKATTTYGPSNPRPLYRESKK